ncbi:MAG: CPBP family intramembrane glutamic endopeptidase [Candidatus Dormibacteria bacterium]
MTELPLRPAQRLSPGAGLVLAGLLILVAVGRDLIAQAAPDHAVTALWTGYSIIAVAATVTLVAAMGLRREPPSVGFLFGAASGLVVATGLTIGWRLTGCQFLGRPGALALTGVAAASLIEELAVRGALWRLFRLSGWHWTWVLVATALTFTVMHGGSRPPQALAPVAAFGLLLGGLRAWTGRVLPSVLCHIAVNAMALWLAC